MDGTCIFLYTDISVSGYRLIYRGHLEYILGNNSQNDGWVVPRIPGYTVAVRIKLNFTVRVTLFGLAINFTGIRCTAGSGTYVSMANI